MKLKGKKILVTGHNGFVGKNLVKELERRDAQVVTLQDENKKRIDIRNWQKIKDIDNLDMIYHLAALTYVPFSFENPRKTYEVNVSGTLNMLELGRLNNIEKFIFMSSYVYGKPHYLPINEKHPINPLNPYAKSKVMGENLCKSYNKDFNLNCIIFRPFNIYGNNQNSNFLIPSIIKQLKVGKIKLKDPEPKRDFLHLIDLIDALIKAGKYNEKFNVFNLGYGKSYSVKQIVDKIIDIYGKDIDVKYTGEKRKNEIMNTVADTKKINKKLGWTPHVTLDKGLNTILNKI